MSGPEGRDILPDGHVGLYGIARRQSIGSVGFRQFETFSCQKFTSGRELSADSAGQGDRAFWAVGVRRRSVTLNWLQCR